MPHGCFGLESASNFVKGVQHQPEQAAEVLLSLLDDWLHLREVYLTTGS